MKRLYLCGKMSGMPDWNFPAFHAAAKRIRELGYECENPAENDNGDTSKSWEYYLRKDLASLLTCDAVACLPGWQDSRGASLEVYVARALSMPILDAGTLEPVDDPITHEAHRLVGGKRQNDYGHPIDDFSRTGRMWAPILNVPEVTPEQVGLCMIALKISREVNRPKRDNRTDIAGYAETLDLIAQRRSEDGCQLSHGPAQPSEPAQAGD